MLITGGAGFIGSHLAEKLLSCGAEVTVLDDLSTGAMSNIDPLVDRDGFRHRIGSVRDAPLVGELVDRCDVTVHLAAAVGVQLIVDEPVHTIETNVHGTEVVLHAVAKKKKPILLASTSEVYGKSSNVPFSEDDDLVLGPTVNSRWSYACSKALDEWLALAYQRQRGIPVTIARLFNTVGPRQTGRYGMVLPTFARQALTGEPITVYGSGEQTRSFMHVRDAVEALRLLLEDPSTTGEVFNVGSDEEVSINELARVVRREADSDSDIVHVPYEEAYSEGFEDMQRRVPDVEKLERRTGFRAGIELPEIVGDVVDDQRRRLSAEVPSARTGNEQS